MNRSSTSDCPKILPLAGILALLVSVGIQATQLTPIEPTASTWINSLAVSILLLGSGLGLLRTVTSEKRFREGSLGKTLGHIGICLAYLAFLAKGFSAPPTFTSLAYLAILVGTHLCLSSSRISNHLERLKKTLPEDQPLTQFLIFWAAISATNLWMTLTLFR